MLEICFINPHLVTALMSMMWTIWTVYMITIYLLRNVRSSFNEFREMTGSLVILILCTIFNQIVLYQVPRFPLSLGWRIAMITIDQVTGNYIWWMIMGRTIYNCMFRRDEYLIQWRHKMIDDGLRAEYGVGGFENDVSVGSNTLVISQNGQRLTSKNMMSTKVFEAEQQSCSESTRIALEGLAALSESRRPRLISSPGGQWQEYSSEGLGSISSSEFQHRHSISYTRSTTCDDGAAIASMSTSQIFGKRSEGGMYANLRTKSMPWLRAEAAEDSAEAFLFVDSSPHEVISTSRRGSGRDAELEITIDAPLHARNSFDSHSSMDEQAQGSQNNRGPTDSCDEDNQKWQRSDTDLSAITTHFNSNRRLI
ncbi:hypothetical protein FBU59_004942 [Linderina macrospora]|uniref:Uncharacterized protein n=1 Tax=Linderina macrospora TaxID=4868 RepID=A0ACC1J454_9FUNG|nr:hypothetical protein FBU59_004942 [Linderina macrospora]